MRSEGVSVILEASVLVFDGGVLEPRLGATKHGAEICRDSVVVEQAEYLREDTGNSVWEIEIRTILGIGRIAILAGLGSDERGHIIVRVVVGYRRGRPTREINGNPFILDGDVARGEEWVGETFAVEPVGGCHLRRRGVFKEVEGRAKEWDELSRKERGKDMEG